MQIFLRNNRNVVVYLECGDVVAVGEHVAQDVDDQ